MKTLKLKRATSAFVVMISAVNAFAAAPAENPETQGEGERVAAPACVFDPHLLPENPVYQRNASCSDVDLRSTATIPRKQGDDYAYCFAYGSAEIVSQRTCTPVSGVALGTNYYLSDVSGLSIYKPGGPDPIAIARENAKKKGQKLDECEPLPKVEREMKSDSELTAQFHPELIKYLKENPEIVERFRLNREDTDVGNLELIGKWKDFKPVGAKIEQFTHKQKLAGGKVKVDKYPVTKIPYVHKLEGGDEDLTVVLANLTGLCTEDDLPSYDGFSKYLAELEEWMRFNNHRKHVQTDGSLDQLPPKLRSELSDFVNSEWLKKVKTACKFIKPPVPLIPVRYEPDVDRQGCVSDAKNFAEKMKWNKNIWARVDYALDHNRIPAIGYNWLTTGKSAIGKRSENYHSSPIMARKKFADGSCRYLIKDIGGYKCEEFYKKYGTKENCADSHFWIKDVELETIDSVTYLR